MKYQLTKDDIASAFTVTPPAEDLEPAELEPAIEELTKKMPTCTISGDEPKPTTKEAKKEGPTTFLSLPTELREHIYNLVFTEHPIRFVPTLPTRTNIVYPMFLFANRQIYVEGMQHFYLGLYRLADRAKYYYDMAQQDKFWLELDENTVSEDEDQYGKWVMQMSEADGKEQATKAEYQFWRRIVLVQEDKMVREGWWVEEV